MYEHLINNPVCIRSNLSGVWLGHLLAAHPDGTLRLRGRRLWSWTGALECTTLAAVGPTSGKVGPESDVVLAPGAQVVEVIAATDAALAALALVSPWPR